MSGREYEFRDNLTGRDARAVGLAPIGHRPHDPHLKRSDRRDYVQALAGFPVFAKCTQRDLAALVDDGAPFSFPAGWAVVSENTPGDSCYVVTKGEAIVYRDRKPISTVAAGSLIGEMSVLTGSLRRATVTTSTRMSGLFIDNEKLVKLLQSRPSLLEALRDVFAVRAAAAGREFEPAPLPTRRVLGLSLG